MANRESWGAVLFLAALLAGAVFLFSGLYAPGPERARRLRHPPVPGPGPLCAGHFRTG